MKAFLIDMKTDLHMKYIQELRFLGVDIIYNYIINEDVSSIENLKKCMDFSIVDTISFMLPEFILKLNTTRTWHLTPEIRRVFRGAECEFLALSDRYTFMGLSVVNRRNIFAHLLNYFIDIIKVNKPDFILGMDIPHHGWDNILHSVASYFNVKTIYLDQTLIGELSFLTENYLTIDKVPLSFLEGETIDQLKEMLPEFIDDQLSSSSKTQQLTSEFVSQSTAFSSGFRFYFDLVVLFIKKISRIDCFLIRDICIDCIYNGKLRRYKLYFLRATQYFSRRKMLMLYKKISIKKIANQPYVFLPLSMQPERTSIPQVFPDSDFELMIRHIHEHLPEGWKLLIKEHPAQFHKDLFIDLYRSISFYNMLNNLKNVEIVDLSISSKELLGKAKVVCVGAGSAGWEMMTEHLKPVIAYGRPWYAAVRSCFHPGEGASLHDLFLILENKPPEEIELDILKFLLYKESHFVPIISSMKVSDVDQKSIRLAARKVVDLVRDLS